MCVGGWRAGCYHKAPPISSPDSLSRPCPSMMLSQGPMPDTSKYNLYQGLLHANKYIFHVSMDQFEDVTGSDRRADDDGSDSAKRKGQFAEQKE